jgi:hypothetical protein|tara:strand:- start:327 stop:530 length:204 start_codon:yes stop_codon:yes gene_type:complete
MEDLVYDCQSLTEICKILSNNNREDLIDYIKYLCETLITIDDNIDDDDIVEEDYEVGKTQDGFYYLK